nr:pyocin knob domain-containing S74 family peptidase [Pseudoxanthomonas sp. PXM02]
MGAGNGLDADLLDGQQGAYYRDYANLTNKPPTFPPSAHGHAWGDLSGVPAFASRWPTYAEVTDKPASYPPSAHTHAAGDITSGTFADARIPALAISKTTGLQTALDGKSPVAHTHDWAAIDNKPGTYPPSAHSHAIAEIVGLIAALAAKADAAHTHAAGDITSGTLAAERIPALPISLITNLQTILDAVVRKDANQNTIPASMTDWRLAAGTAEGNDILQLRLQSGGAFSTARGAILELNGANAASNGGGWRLLGAAGSQSVISGGAGSTVTFQTATYNFTSALQVNSFPVWHAGTFTPTNIPTQTGDLLVSKASSIIGIGVSGGRNGGMCNFANDGIGDVGLFSEYADGRLRMRPNGRLSATGELSVSITGATWNGNAMWHAGNFDPASKANSAHTHAAGDVTSGTFAAARISVASVTQHQSALSIGWTQVFDAGTLGEWRTISPSTKISVNGSFADAAGTNPEYKAGNSSFDCNDMPVGTRALVSQVGNLNLPPAVAGVSFWYVECRNSYTGATTRQQTAWAYNGSAAELCTRHLQGGTWSAWARSWSSANFDPNSKAPVNNPVFTGVVTAPVFDQGSARRLKKDIEDLHPDDALADIMAVAFKTYALRSDGSLQRGVIADDLLDGPLGFAVRLNEHGQPEAVNYQVLFVTACAALQCLTERVAVLEKRSRHG